MFKLNNEELHTVAVFFLFPFSKENKIKHAGTFNQLAKYQNIKEVTTKSKIHILNLLAEEC